MRRRMELSVNIRKYGKPPFRVAVLHGGPGAPGYMAPVARELSKTAGVIEPLQTRDSLEGQIRELGEQITGYADPPVALIGSSWGAVLALFLAARNRKLVNRLVLVGSAVFDRESSASIEGRRLSRLSEEKRRRHEIIQMELEQASGKERDRLMDEWGSILFETDVYDPVTNDLEVIETQYDIFSAVWSQFVVLRDRPGYLMSEFSHIDLPTLVIHGDYDPHPIEGIRPFLETCISDIRFEILPRCGHYPWIEKQGRERFLEILREEIKVA
jgi:pimeloyl-ACP methyl ester carboxylesterase